MILNENIIYFGIKTLLTLFFCFPLLVYVLNGLMGGLLGIAGNRLSFIFIYFAIYEILNILFFLYKIKIIMFIVSFIDCTVAISSLVLFIYFIFILCNYSAACGG
jgi:hypothetical protein